MRILITSGATQEPIDGVRYITNFSSGKTGANLAEFLAAKHNVTLIYGANSTLPDSPVINQMYRTFKDLNHLLMEVLENNFYDLIIHAAAIGDYSVSHIEINGKAYQPSELSKIQSDANPIIHTQRNFKIIDRLKDYALSNPNVVKPPILVGFKLTNTADKECQKREVSMLASHAPVDFIVHNDLYEMRSQRIHLFNVYKGDNELKPNITIEGIGSAPFGNPSLSWGKE